MTRRHKSTNILSRALAASLVCFLLLFLVQIVAHDHQNGRDEGSCRVCHAAHFGSVPATTAYLLTAPLLQNGRVHEISFKFHKSLFANDAPSRAPPTA